MKSLADHLSNYAAYHRDRRNIATHFVGIPMIVLGVATLLARPAIDLGGGVALAPIAPVTLGAILFYLALDVRLGLTMAALMIAAMAQGTWFGAQSTSLWLGAGLGLFVVGWVIQFVGHIYEGKKPAFVDDLIGLLVGPLFVVTEAGFALGLRKDLAMTIEARVGPTHSGQRAGAATTGA